jgi:PUA domain protein
LVEAQIKNRHPLRKKESKRILSSIEEQLGITLDLFRKSTLEQAELNNQQVIVINREILGFFVDSKPFLTIRGFLALGELSKDAKKFITVDKGAVKFVYNGADVMVPGIVDADQSIETEELVWVREESHLKPLAVGKAVLGGPQVSEAKSGKAVKTLHHVGDWLWSTKI